MQRRKKKCSLKSSLPSRDVKVVAAVDSEMIAAVEQEVIAAAAVVGDVGVKGEAGQAGLAAKATVHKSTSVTKMRSPPCKTEALSAPEAYLRGSSTKPYISMI